MGCVIKYKGQSIPEEQFLQYLNKQIAINNLFNENETLANAVYEALGFGLKQRLKSKFYTEDTYNRLKTRIDVFNKEKTLDNLINVPFYIKNAPKNIKEKLGVYHSAEEDIFGEETDESGYKGFIISYENGQFNLYTSKNYGMIEAWGIGFENQEKLDISLAEIKELIKYAEPSRDTEQRWKEINEAVKLIPQQKQQALQVYSQYLDTIFPDSKVAEIDDSLYNNVLNQLEQENIIDKDCNGGGKLKAEKGLQTNFNRGGKWKLIKDLKGYPTHKEGGVDLTIGKNGVSIKNGNTEFIAKHGLVIPKN